MVSWECLLNKVRAKETKRTQHIILHSVRFEVVIFFALLTEVKGRNMTSFLNHNFNLLFLKNRTHTITITNNFFHKIFLSMKIFYSADFRQLYYGF